MSFCRSSSFLRHSAFCALACTHNVLCEDCRSSATQCHAVSEHRLATVGSPTSDSFSSRVALWDCVAWAPAHALW